MSSTIFLSVASLCYIIMILIVYFAKERVNTSENNVFKKLLIISFCSLLAEIYIALMPPSIDSLPFVISLKVYLVLCVFWLSYFMEYVFIITRNNTKKALINYKKDYKGVYIIFWIITALISTAIIILPIYFFNEGGMKYSYGPSVNIVFGLSGIYTLIMGFYIIKNIKNLKNKGYMPIIFLVFLLLAAAVIQKINPSLLIANTCFALITSLMYHTIENPDIKMIKELMYSKAVAEQSKQLTLNTLDEISDKLSKSLTQLVAFGYKKINKNDVNELNSEMKYIQKYSVRFADELSGLIDLAKLDSGELNSKEEKYDVNEMINDIRELLVYKKGNKKITLTIDSSDNINKILYGDSEKIQQSVSYLFSYIIDIIKQGTINIKIDDMKVGRFCRLKFHFFIDNDKINEYASIDKYSGRIKLDGNTNNLDYLNAKKIVHLLDGKIEFKDSDSNITELILSIDQKVLSSYQILDQKEENENIKVKYFNLSNKKILIVDDNRTKLKDIMLLLKPYSINYDIARNYTELLSYITSDKPYDMILVDEIISDFDEEVNSLPNIIQKEAGYEIKTVLMINNAKDEQKYLECGFDNCIIKPINKGNLNELLQDLLKNR